MDNEIQNIINIIVEKYPKIKFKICRKCFDNFPVHPVFFLKENRVEDGYENKCRKCRGKDFAFDKVDSIEKDINKKVLPHVDFTGNVIKDYELYLETNVLPNRNFIKDNYKEICIYLFEEKYKFSDHELTSLNRDWVKFHKLYGLLTFTFNGSIYALINNIYPDRLNAWDFVTVGRLYWNDDNNVKYALNWFVNKLYDDGIIDCLDDLPNTVTKELFNKYNLGGLLSGHFNGQPNNAIDFILPGKFDLWDYRYKGNIYKDKQLRINYIKYVIEDELNINVEDIPYKISYMYFHYINKGNICGLLRNYYDSDIYNCINEVYPNRFNKNQFGRQNHYKTLDDEIVKSEEERMIHHIFINNKLDIHYEQETFKDYLKNKKYNPDWTLYIGDKEYIIEYYGMMSSKSDIFNYKNKYHMKDKFYNEMVKDNKELEYIPLFREDIYNNFIGLIDKFNNIGLSLKVD